MKPAPPATAANPVSESQLATVTLTPDAERRLGLQIVDAKVESVLRTRTAGGEVIAPPGRSIVMTAPIAGTIRGRAVTAGARVAAGQTVFTIFPLQDMPAEREVGIEAQREVTSAGAELQAAEQRLTRLEGLLKEGATSARSVEDARVQRDLVAARLTAARERLATVRSGTVGTRGEIALRAPFSGVLQQVSAAPGQTVASAQPLFAIAQTDAVWIRVPLYVGERNGIDVSEPAVVRSLGAASGSGIVAKPVEGPPSGNAAAATADLFFAPTVTDATLRLGDRVSVELPLLETQQALVVPAAALLYDLYGGTWVYEARGDHAYVRRRVEVGAQFANRVVIAQGLSAGQRVVTAGAAELFGTEFGAGK